MLLNLETDIQGILDKILKHHFNTELLEGTLCKKRFVFYLLQDRYYLKDYAKALAITAARLDDHKNIKIFLQFALEAIDDEQALHVNYLNQFGTIIAELNVTEPSPACFMYTNYLLQTAHTKSVEQSIAALLPCFYVYQKVAEHMQSKLVDLQSHPYGDWINLYSGDEFCHATELAFSVLQDRINAENIDDIKKAFIYSTKLEWLFWDSAYRMEAWQI